MADRYDERYRNRGESREWGSRRPDLEHREQRAGSWRDEGPDGRWLEPDGFGRDDRRDERDEFYRRDREYRYRDQDAGARAGTWSVGHGGGTDRGYGYGGGMESWQDRGRGSAFAGRGPKNYRRSDERIREEVNERLTVHPDVDATEIEVAVTDCEVMLSGTVETRDQKRIAEDCAWNVHGVREVNNRIRVDILDRQT